MVFGDTLQIRGIPASGRLSSFFSRLLGAPQRPRLPALAIDRAPPPRLRLPLTVKDEIQGPWCRQKDHGLCLACLGYLRVSIHPPRAVLTLFKKCLPPHRVLGVQSIIPSYENKETT